MHEVGSNKLSVPVLSTGQESRLGVWHSLSKATFGAESKATLYLEEMIAGHQAGADEIVLANEGQFLIALMKIHGGSLSATKSDTRDN
mgnify:CR=1 FL=1